MISIGKDSESVLRENVQIPERLRRLDEKRVADLVASIREIGLATPIVVRSIADDNLILVTGRHRLEAAARLDMDFVQARFLVGSDDDARLWEISENLHRAELSVAERADHIAEWVRLTEKNAAKDKPAQVAPVSKGGRGKQGGINAAVRELGIERTEAQRSIKIAGIVPEAKEACTVAGLDDNQSVLLKVARRPPEEQVAVVKELSEARKKPKPKAKPVRTDLADEAAEFLTETLEKTELQRLLSYWEEIPIAAIRAALGRLGS